MELTYIKKVIAFREEAHKILSTHEESPSRAIQLRQTYLKLSKLSIQQDELFQQALKCVENALFRAAHVMAWAGFIDFIEEKLASDQFKKLCAVRPKWKFSTIEELREIVPEYQIIEATQEVGLCRKGQVRVLLGLLNKRNECAHPSSYNPDLNETLGYISELIQRINQLKPIKL